MEEFKDIEEYEGRYQISNYGRVYSTPLDGKPAKFLNLNIQEKNHTSYHTVALSKYGKATTFSVHRLVAKAFIPNPENKLHINHIDNDGTNNHVSNLEWVTHSENMLHAGKQGRLTETTRKAQAASVAAKYETTMRDIETNYYHKVFGYLKVLPYVKERISRVTGHKRILLQCTCTLCNSGKVISKERYQLNQDKQHVCQSCGSRLGGTGKSKCRTN
jgi:hypothetical protein